MDEYERLKAMKDQIVQEERDRTTAPFKAKIAALEAEAERLKTENIALKAEVSDVRYGSAAEIRDLLSDRELWAQRAEAAEALLAKCREYIAGVNIDCPRGTDDDRDNLLDAIDAARAALAGKGAT